MPLDLLAVTGKTEEEHRDKMELYLSVELEHMGKKSNRVVNSFKSDEELEKKVKQKFQAVHLPSKYKDCLAVKCFEEAVKDGVITKHEVGLKGGYIASRFEWETDKFDELMSVSKEDRDFEGLMGAHLKRLAEVAGMGDPDDMLE